MNFNAETFFLDNKASAHVISCNLLNWQAWESMKSAFVSRSRVPLWDRVRVLFFHILKDNGEKSFGKAFNLAFVAYSLFFPMLRMYSLGVMPVAFLK